MKTKFLITTCECWSTVRCGVQGPDFPALLPNLATSKITVPVTVSIHDFFIVKLNVNNYRCMCEEKTSATMDVAGSSPKICRSCLEVRKPQIVLTQHSPSSLSFGLFIYSFTRIKYRLRWWNYIFVLPVELSRIPRDFRQ